MTCNQIWYCRYLSPGIYYLLVDHQDHPTYSDFWYFTCIDPNHLGKFCCFCSRSVGKILSLVIFVTFVVEIPFHKITKINIFYDMGLHG